MSEFALQVSRYRWSLSSTDEISLGFVKDEAAVEAESEELVSGCDGTEFLSGRESVCAVVGSCSRFACARHLACAPSVDVTEPVKSDLIADNMPIVLFSVLSSVIS